MTLTVDYGNKKITLNYEVWVGRDNTIFDKRKWCEETFKPDTFRYYQGVMYFKRKKDLTWFTMRWL